MITKFGTHDGRDVLNAELSDGETKVSILNYGALTREWQVRGIPVVLGFDSFDPYPVHSRSFGIIAGRVANRTAHGRFALEGVDYQLPQNSNGHHLHGGDLGLGRRIWDMEAQSGGRGVRLRYHSPDGEEGYPGAVDFDISITLSGPTLTYEMTAMPDRATPINLAQHNYYNLNGTGDVRRHDLRIAAAAYTPVDQDLIPTGEILPVAGTHLDFRANTQMGAIDPRGIGIDHNLVLDQEAEGPQVVAQGDETGLELRLWTDQPGVQLFNAPALSVAVPGFDHTRYGAFSGFCLEPQGFPDSLNKPDFPSIIASPDRPYHQKLVVDIR